MTVFAGVFCMSQGQLVPPALKTALIANVCRASEHTGTRQTHDVPRLLLTKWDSGAYNEPAWRAEPDGSICTLAGDPLLTCHGERIARPEQLERLAPAGRVPQDAAFMESRGSFAFAHYSAAQQTLSLATDAVGLRSIYYTVQDGLLIFATALRILEAIPAVGKTLSVPGLAELSVFSFPLAERTPYEELHLLRESEILTASDAGVALRGYRDWSVQAESATTPDAAAAQLHAIFEEAIRLRVGDDRRVYSFLSGGMDSRAIVATLIGQGHHVEALNFSANASQDQFYAQSFAQTAGEVCHLHCLKGGSYPNFSFLALAAKTALEQRQATHVDRPQFIWSGDGGSVGLGHVYMDERMLDLGAMGDADAAIRHFLEINRNVLPGGVLTAEARHQLPRMLFDNVMSEVNRYPVSDFGRRVYLFLLFNDQRRHLFKHFETIDQHGLELLTPFYDTRLLEAVVATPSRWGILHRLYAGFFEHLPPFALQSPWQTYPGHVPCPLPRDERASYQWARSTAQDSGGLRARLRFAASMLDAIDDQHQPPTFSTARVWTAALMHSLGLRDCSHILSALQTYQHHHTIAKTSRPGS